MSRLSLLEKEALHPSWYQGFKGKKYLNAFANLSNLSVDDLKWLVIRSLKALETEANQGDGTITALRHENEGLNRTLERFRSNIATLENSVAKTQRELGDTRSSLERAQQEIQKIKTFSEPLNGKNLHSAVVSEQLRAVREQISEAAGQGVYSLVVPVRVLCLETILELYKEGFTCAECEHHKESALRVGVNKPKPGIVIWWGTSPIETTNTKPLNLLEGKL